MPLPNRPANPVINPTGPHAANLVSLVPFATVNFGAAFALVGTNLNISGAVGTAYEWLTGELGGPAVRRLTTASTLFFSATTEDRVAGTIVMVLRRRPGSNVFWNAGTTIGLPGSCVLRATDSDVIMGHTNLTGAMVFSNAGIAMPVNEWIPMVFRWSVAAAVMQLAWAEPDGTVRLLNRSTAPNVGVRLLDNQERVAGGVPGASGGFVDAAAWDVLWYHRLNIQVTPGGRDGYLGDPFSNTTAAALPPPEPDSLVLYHTAGIWDDDPGDPPYEERRQPHGRQSTGFRGSTSRARFLGWTLAGGDIPGVRIEWLSPACGPGLASLTASGADALVFTAPGDAQGAPVTILDGETRAVLSADMNRYVLVRRVGSDPFAGKMDLELADVFNNALCGSNVSTDEQFASDTGRCYGLALTNTHPTEPITDLTIWAPPLGTPQQILNPANGLPAGSTPGELNLPDVSDWHPHTRYVLLTQADGLTPKELVSGYLDGDTFVVAVRGLEGIGPAATAANDWAVPISPARFCIGSPGVSMPPTTLQRCTRAGIPGTEVQPWDIPEIPNRSLDPPFNIWLPTPLGGTPSPGDPTNISGWSRAFSPSLPYTFPQTIGPGQRCGLYLNAPSLQGLAPAPQTPVTLAWRYTLGGRVYQQSGRGLFRIAADLSASRYRAYRRVDGGQRTLLATAAELPMLNVGPLALNAENVVEVVRVNDYGLEGLIASRTLSLVGGAASEPPSPPFEVSVHQVGPLAVSLGAFYAPDIDADPADLWEYQAEPDLAGTHPLVALAGLAELRVELTHAAWTDGVKVNLQVRVRRTSDDAVSPWVEASVDMVEAALAATEDARTHHERRELLSDEPEE